MNTQADFNSLEVEGLFQTEGRARAKAQRWETAEECIATSTSVPRVVEVRREGWEGAPRAAKELGLDPQVMRF